MSTKKNMAKKAQNENAAAAAQVENVVANEAVVENVVEAAETSQAEDKAAETSQAEDKAAETSQAEDKAAAAKAEAERLMAAAKEAAAAAKAAAKEAKEAAKKAKAFSSRPVRLARFEAQLGAEVISKTDVHYCAEKAAIDYVADLRNNGEYTDQVIEIWKVYKDEQWAEAEKNVCLSKVYIDVTTGQIVID